MERAASLRCVHPGQLSTRFRIEQLAEPCPATSVADSFIRRIVCHALAHFRRGDGHRTRPPEWPANYSDGDWQSPRQTPNRLVSVGRDCFGAVLFSRLDHHGVPSHRRALVSDRRDSTVEKPGLHSKTNAPFLVGLERRRAAGNVLELEPRHADARVWLVAGDSSRAGHAPPPICMNIKRKDLLKLHFVSN